MTPPMRAIGAVVLTVLLLGTGAIFVSSGGSSLSRSGGGKGGKVIEVNIHQTVAHNQQELNQLRVEAQVHAQRRAKSNKRGKGTTEEGWEKQQQGQEKLQQREVKAPFFKPGKGVDEPPKPTRDPMATAAPVREVAFEKKGEHHHAPDGEGQYPILRYPSTEINYKLGPTLAEGKRIEGDGDCSHFNAMPQKYLSFEPWPGGWNNRRLSLECAATLALLSNRTLILPPLATVVHDDHIQGAKMMGYEHAYNMTMMQYFLPAVSFKQFLKCGKNLLESLPDIDFEKRNCNSVPYGSKDKWYCEQSVPVSRKAGFVKASGGDFYPIPLDDYRYKRDPKGHHRKPNKFPASATSAFVDQPIIHYQRNLLSTPSNMVYILPELRDSSISLRPSDLAETDRMFEKPLTVRQRVFGALRDGLQYQDHIKRAAAHVVHKFLGGVDGFSAIHFRRRDFTLAYKHMVGEPCQMVDNLSPLFKVGETIFIASDDDNGVEYALNRCNKTSNPHPSDLKFVSWNSLLRADAGNQFINLLGTQEITTTQVPLVVQEICVAARIFSPNAYSTLSGLIVRLRGHREDPIKAIGPYYGTITIPTIQLTNFSSSIAAAGEEEQQKKKGEGAVAPSERGESSWNWGVRKTLGPPTDERTRPYNFPNPAGPTWGHETILGHEHVEFPTPLSKKAE